MSNIRRLVLALSCGATLAPILGTLPIPPEMAK